MFYRAGGSLKHKVHLMRHLVDNVGLTGNPRFFKAYYNESINGTLARIARSCHRRRWNELVHKEYNIMLSLGLSVSMNL